MEHTSEIITVRQALIAEVERDRDRLRAINTDLLAALEALLAIETDGDCGECYICSEHDSRMDSAITKAQAAINSAKGA